MDNDLNLMHDWTLLDVLCQWNERTAILNLRSSNGENAIFISGLKKLNMTSDHPWGNSVSINRFLECDLPKDKTHKLSIEMQSGDLILIEAEVIKLPIKEDI